MLVLIAALLVFAVLLGGLGQVIPSIRAVTMPRFGWVGLMLCMNPLIFLLPAIWNPTRSALMGAALMCVSLSAINAVQLLLIGTVPTVENVFTDRMHSSWFWSLVPIGVAGIYLYWHAVRLNPNPLGPQSGQPTQEQKP